MRQELDCKVEISWRGRLIQHFSFRKKGERFYNFFFFFCVSKVCRMGKSAQRENFNRKNITDVSLMI